MDGREGVPVSIYAVSRRWALNPSRCASWRMRAGEDEGGEVIEALEGGAGRRARIAGRSSPHCSGDVAVVVAGTCDTVPAGHDEAPPGEALG